jgi:hypothetical protein
MKRMQFLAILVSVFCIAILHLGCAGKKNAPAFTEEQLETMPPAQREGLPSPSGGLVLKVNNDVLTLDDVVGATGETLGPIARQSADESRFGAAVRPQLERFIWNRISEMVLYQQANKDLSENFNAAIDKAVEQDVSQFLGQFKGDYAEAEKALKEMGLDWNKFRKERRKLIITQFFISEQLKDDAPISHGDLLEYYNIVKDKLYSAGGKIEFRLIDIRPARLGSDTGEGETWQTRKEAQVLAERLIERINNGEDFGELAKEYSHGHRASQGGLWNPVETGSLAEPYDVLEKQVEDMEPGEVAGPVEADGHIFIIKLENKQMRSFRSFEDVQYEIERHLLNERRRRALDRLLAKYLEQAEVGDIDTFIDLVVSKIYREYSR